MTDINPERITGNISIVVLPQDNGQYVCELSNSLYESSQNDIRCYGQNKEHAIAIALEQLATEYRRIAEEQQNIDWLMVERSDSGEPIEKLYHILLHYERTIEAESKFEAMQNTLMGNTVVENANLTMIEIENDLPIAPLSEKY